MDAASDLEFSALANEAAGRLWPGRVRIDGIEYPCALSRKRVRIVMGGGMGAQVRETSGIEVEIHKNLLGDALPQDTVVVDLSTGGIYTVKEVAGQGENDAAWFFTCAKHER